MESLRMEYVVPQHPAVPGLEFRPEERGPEAEVLVSVHVRIRDGRVPFGPRRIRPRDIDVRVIPGGLPSPLERPQVDLLPGRGDPLRSLPPCGARTRPGAQ